MPVTLNVKSADPVLKAQRKAAAQRVLDYFGDSLPSSRLLCFLDDDDPSTLKGELGRANRGLYGPIHDSTPLAHLPDYVTSCILVDDGISLPFPRVIDDLVYLYGSTCANEVGLTMTLAHELQHAIQHSNARKLWALNSLVGNVGGIITAFKMKWKDIPTELEARIVAKRVAESIFGGERVAQYIDSKIAERVTEDDADDWMFIRSLSPSSAVDIVADTQLLFERLQKDRPLLDRELKIKRENLDFADIDLDAFFT